MNCVTFNCADLILVVLNTPRLACINFSVFLTEIKLRINTLLEYINCEYLC